MIIGWKLLLALSEEPFIQGVGLVHGVAKGGTGREVPSALSADACYFGEVFFQLVFQLSGIQWKA